MDYKKINKVFNMDRDPRLNVDKKHAYNGYSPIDNEYNKKYRNPAHHLPASIWEITNSVLLNQHSNCMPNIVIDIVKL